MGDRLVLPTPIAQGPAATRRRILLRIEAPRAPAVKGGIVLAAQLLAVAINSCLTHRFAGSLCSLARARRGRGHAYQMRSRNSRFKVVKAEPK